ncbi:MAG TPA: hypothetical protein VGH13_12050 [Xanthobacteraceae bacterium]|jgi:hypothetical protein
MNKRPFKRTSWEPSVVRKASEYDQYATECQAMAAKTRNPVHKKQLEEMAAAWAMLARERRKQLQKQTNGTPVTEVIEGKTHPLDLIRPGK